MQQCCKFNRGFIEWYGGGIELEITRAASTRVRKQFVATVLIQVVYSFNLSFEPISP
jgi:hypothetical protein